MHDMEVMSMYMEPTTGMNAQMAAVQQQTSKISAKSASTSKAKDTEVKKAKKAESTDGLLELQIAKEPDESVTLSIQADNKLIDEKKNIDMDRLKKFMERATAMLPHSDAKFGIHEKTNRITIKLVDRETQEIIKEIPPEKTLDLLAKRMELAGVLLDEKL